MPAVPTSPDTPETWEVVLRLGAIFMGLADRPTPAVDDLVFRQFAASGIKQGEWPGLAVDEIAAKLDGAVGPTRIIDMLIRMGPYGDGFGRRPEGLTLARVREATHGIDLGPMQPRLREILNTPSGLVELAPPLMTADLPRLRLRMATARPSLVLIGRRDLRASNSFMHNLPSLVKGPERC